MEFVLFGIFSINRYGRITTVEGGILLAQFNAHDLYFIFKLLGKRNGCFVTPSYECNEFKTIGSH